MAKAQPAGIVTYRDVYIVRSYRDARLTRTDPFFILSRIDVSDASFRDEENVQRRNSAMTSTHNARAVRLSGKEQVERRGELVRARCQISAFTSCFIARLISCTACRKCAVASLSYAALPDSIEN
jgi:hypothetical protein